MCEREIKFRGKRVNNGEWVYGDLWQPVRDNQKIAFILRQDNKYEVVPETVGQFTGLKDRNGVGDCENQPKDAYHKDICLYRDDSGHNQTGIIEWSETQARIYLEAIGGDDEGNQDGDLDRWFEVIGNIHDNPELLEAKNVSS